MIDPVLMIVSKHVAEMPPPPWRDADILLMWTRLARECFEKGYEEGHDAAVKYRQEQPCVDIR